MPVENLESFNYYSISREGKVRATSGENKDTQYDAIWGVLIGIDLVEDEYEGEKIFKWHFKMEDPDHTRVEILQVGEASSAARGIIMSLVSISGNIHQVRLKPYRTTAGDKTYTNCAVYHRTHTADRFEQTPEWDKKMIDNLPEIEQVELSDRTVKDDGKRRIYVRKLAAHIKKQKLNPAPAPQTKEYVDEHGEVHDTPPHPGDDLYTAPDKVKQQRTEIHNNFEDMDDDLPFIWLLLPFAYPLMQIMNNSSPF